MRVSFYLLLFTITISVTGQDFYAKARQSFNVNELDSARYYINKSLVRKPSAEDYFLSALIHEAEGASLRALADYEAVIQKEPDNLEAYFQKGLIYFHSASNKNAVADFSHVIQNIDQSQTRAIYFGNDPHGVKGTFVTTLQSMKGKVHQYRGMAYQNLSDWDSALDDFNVSLEYDSSAEVFVNRSRLFSKMGNEADAINDLKMAISLEQTNYLAWYNLALLDESTQLPAELINDDTFSPMLDLFAANAYELEDYPLAVQYYSKSLGSNEKDDLALVGRGKALLRMESYRQARTDFIKALQLNPARTEAFYLIGNSFFYEKSYQDAIGFYEQYLSIDPSYENVWYNAAMSYLSTKDGTKACSYLKKAADLGMVQANTMIDKHCDNQ